MKKLNDYLNEGIYYNEGDAIDPRPHAKEILKYVNDDKDVKIALDYICAGDTKNVHDHDLLRLIAALLKYLKK